VPLLLSGFPGSGVWAQIGGVIFGAGAKLVCVAAPKVKRGGHKQVKWRMLAGAGVLICTTLAVLVVQAVRLSTRAHPLCPACYDACYDIACWCDIEHRLKLPQREQILTSDFV
jgi:hypothetical protein